MKNPYYIQSCALYRALLHGYWGLRTECAASAQLSGKYLNMLWNSLRTAARRAIYGCRKRLGSFPSLRTDPYNNTPLQGIIRGSARIWEKDGAQW